MLKAGVGQTILFHLIPFFLFFNALTSHANPSSPFPLDNYSQNIDLWIKPSNPDYDNPLLTVDMQKQRSEELYQHYFGMNSPWNAAYVTAILTKPPHDDLQALEQLIIQSFSNYTPDNKFKANDEQGYNGCHVMPYSDQWIVNIKNNINLSQLSNESYGASLRGIAIDNLNARALPTNDVYFLNCDFPGEGPPFDYLQMSAIWAGTPVYILGETADHAWYLVVTPDLIAWVQSNGIARVNQQFVNTWGKTARKNLVAITNTKISISDTEKNKNRFFGFIGAIFPLARQQTADVMILIPVANKMHQAKIYHATLSKQNAAVMPVLATQRHMIEIIKNLIGRPYGWGNMDFNNDCSAELKSLYTPFGIWLPRHSSYQVDPSKIPLNTVNLSHLTIDQRLDYLAQNGHKFMNIVYIGGHIFLYLGNYSNPNNSAMIVPLSYQNMWGLRPKNATPETDRRAVVGKAVIFPLLKNYPEDVTLNPHANHQLFIVGYLDEPPSTQLQSLWKQTIIDLRYLMFP